MQLSEAEAKNLLQAAREAAVKAYAPYSEFPVGAALLTEGGEIITGCNVENASYGLTLCAERVAIGKAVSEGSRRFRGLAVWAEKRLHGAVTPCGACRQVMSEFLTADCPVVMADAESGQPRQMCMQDLLPAGFDLTH